jgi:hypothetical protein
MSPKSRGPSSASDQALTTKPSASDKAMTTKPRYDTLSLSPLKCNSAKGVREILREQLNDEIELLSNKKHCTLRLTCFLGLLIVEMVVLWSVDG